MLEAIARFFLNFSHDSVIIPVVILGYICLNKTVFSNAIKLTLLSMLFSYALKVTFQIPLAESTGLKGFAFPSGHMQSSVVLYGYLLVHSRSLVFRFLMSVLLVGIGMSLVYCGYHCYVDVFGAVFFGSLLIAAYEFLRRKEKPLKPIAFCFASFLMCYIHVRHGLLPHLWMAYYSLTGFSVSEFFFCKKQLLEKFSVKCLAMLLCFAFLITVQMIFKIEFFAKLPPYLNQLQWVDIGFCVPFSVFLADFIFRSMKKD